MRTTGDIQAELDALGNEIQALTDEYNEAIRPLTERLSRLQIERWISTIPWEKHTKESLASFPIHPSFLPFVRERAPEPQLSWAIEVSNDYYTERS